jgi:hypothetical protein
MKARTNVFEEKLNKTCLKKTNADIETDQEPREGESKTDLEEMNTTNIEANPEGMKSVANN